MSLMFVILVIMISIIMSFSPSVYTSGVFSETENFTQSKFSTSANFTSLVDVTEITLIPNRGNNSPSDNEGDSVGLITQLQSRQDLLSSHQVQHTNQMNRNKQLQ